MIHIILIHKDHFKIVVKSIKLANQNAVFYHMIKLTNQNRDILKMFNKWRGFKYKFNAVMLIFDKYNKIYNLPFNSYIYKI